MRLLPGTYEHLEILQTMIEPHKVEGEPKIIIVLGEPDDNANVVWDTLWTTNAAWDSFTKKRLMAYGFNPDTTPLFDLRGEDSPLLGKLVGPVVVREEEYENKEGKKAKSSKVERVGEFVVERMDDASAKQMELALSARLGTVVRKASSKPKPPPPPSASDLPPDNDVPF